MEKQTMQVIKDFIIEKCQREFGYCGVAEGENMVMINTGSEKDLIINIEIKDN